MVIAGISNYFFCFSFVFSVPSASSKADQGSSPGGVTQSFTAEESGPLVALLGLGCHSLRLTLIIAKT